MRVVRAIGIGLVLWAQASAGACLAQSKTPTQLREENAALREELRRERARADELESRLAALLNERRGLEGRLSQTESMIAQLRAEMGRVDAPPTPIARAPAGADPLSSPASLLRELRSRYHVAMLGVPNSTPEERADYAEQVQLWCKLTNRELRGKRTWLVKLTDIEPLDRDSSVASMTVLDEESGGLPIGEAVDVRVPKRYLDKLDIGPENDRWLLTAIVIAKPVFNPERQTRGIFEFPPFIGPMVEFDFELDWFGIKRWDPDEPEAEAEDGGMPAEDQSEDGSEDGAGDESEKGSSAGPGAG